jgi:predicted Fe-Mo cluster-binding NifX family protein
MKICIPTTDDTGLHAGVHPGFGDSPWFTLIDPDAGTVLSIPNEAPAHAASIAGPGGLHGPHSESGPCATARRLELRAGDALMCRRLGRRAFRTLAERGILVFRTTGERVSDAVTAIREKRVLPLAEEEIACEHGHERHRHRGGGACCG